MMKQYSKTLLIAGLFLITAGAYAQNVAINATGTAANTSAGLDVDFTNKGFLLPRMNAAQRAAIGTPATGLIVYQTDAGTFGSGFYFFNGTIWVPWGTNNGGWGLSGNTGTVAGTNYLGTTDAVDFVISTNAAERLRILGANGRIGIGTTAPAYFMEVRTGLASAYVASFENTVGTGAALQAYCAAGTTNAFGGVSNFVGGTGVYGVVLQATGGGVGVYGTSNSSNSLGVRGSIPTTGAWLGYGGYFTGGLGYANGVYNVSDRRVKSNIAQIENAIEKIKKIEGVSYTYNSKDYPYIANGDTRTYLGFIAQDIKKVFPEAVAEKSIPVSGPETSSSIYDAAETRYEVLNVVDYTAIIPVLVEATKEQQVIIEQQQKQTKELTDQNKQLTERITLLEKTVKELKESSKK